MSTFRLSFLVFIVIQMVILSACESESPDSIRNPEKFTLRIKGLTPKGPLDYDLNIVESIEDLGSETIRILSYGCKDLPPTQKCRFVTVELAIPARYTNSKQNEYVSISIENKVDNEEHVWNTNETYNSAWRGSLGTALKYTVVGFRYEGTSFSSENLLPAIGFTEVQSDKVRMKGNFSTKMRTNDNIGYTLDISGNFDAVIADDINF